MNVATLTPPVEAIQVRLLGAFRIESSAGPIAIPTGKARSLLAYLLLHPDTPHRRSLLVEELWPDATPARGLRRLADTLYRLRQTLPDAAIVATGETVALNRDLPWWVDVWALSTALNTEAATQLDAALALYTADLLPELDDHWLMAQRVHLQEIFLNAVTRWAATAAAHEDHLAAAAGWRRILRIDPLHEIATRGLMTALARTGQLAAALECYDELVDLLDRELATPPSQETRALAEQLYQELDLARHREAAPMTTRLVGRRQERAALLAALDHARAGQPGLVLLLGEAGMGKSSLLQALADAATWRGWRVYWGEAEPTTPAAPYAPLAQALRRALPAPRADQIASVLPRLWLDLLGGWLPSLRPGPRPAPDPAHSADATHLPQALAALLDQLQTVAPTLLLLDDVQWADPDLWPLLNHVLPHLARQHILIALAARPDTLQAQAHAWSHLEQWDRDGHLHVIPLRGLAADEIAELADTHGFSIPPDQRGPLVSAGAGNPLLTLSILQAGGPTALPSAQPTIAALLQERLARLEPPAREAAGWAAVLGPVIDYTHWATLWQRVHPNTPLAPHAVALERAGVLVIDDDAYRFAHDIYHTVAHQDADAATLQQRHATALDLLATLTPHDPERLLYHAQAAADDPAIGRYALDAGRRAMAAFAYAAAAERLALAQAHLSDPRDRIHAHLLAAQVAHQRAEREQEAAELAALDDLRDAMTDPALVAAILFQHAAHAWAVGLLDEARARVEAGLDLAVAHTDALPLTQVAALHQLAGRIARDNNRRADATAHVRAAQELYAQAGDEWGVALTQDLLGGLAYDRGEDAVAATLHHAAAAAFRRLGDPVREAQSLNNLGSAAWALGDYTTAAGVHERSIEVCRSLGNKRGESDNLDNLGGVAWALGDYPLAIRRYEAALALREAIGDQWGIALSLGNLGSAYRLMGNLEQALTYYERSLPRYREVGRQRGEAYVLRCRGLTLAQMGRHAEAETDLQAELALRLALGDQGRLIESYTALAEAALLRGDLDAAQTHIAASLELTPAAASPALRLNAYFTAYRIFDAAGATEAAQDALARAQRALEQAAAPLSAEDRARFLAQVPLNRATLAAVARVSTIVEACLPAAGGSGTVPVTWHLAMPQDILTPAGSPRRRMVLARLQAEAAAQGAAPTHADLAAALGVSRRTILRDLALDDPREA